jgi:GntR family transcriptional regulator/MocR family aminotransferase
VWAENLIIGLERRTRRSAPPYHRQVFTQIRDAILGGTLRAGDRLPASRELARSLRLARNTVARAYEDLLAGGYIEGRVGSGSYVMADLDLPRTTEPRLKPAPASRSAEAGRARAAAHGSSPAIRIDFRPGISDWEAFPRRLWLRLIGRALRANAAELRRYGEPGGYHPLREAIARHLAISRGVSALAGQVVICNGSQQALDLIARLCLRPGDRAALEDPGYPEARQVLGRGSRPLFVPVDEDGMDVAALERMTHGRPAPRLVYLTPSHQFPTGAVLPLSRRLALLGWAARRDVLVVEDDYDSELRTPGRIVESMQGLDRARKVIYIGTFSTVLFPPLRVGYLVLPPEWTERFLQAKWLADRQTATLDQLALTAFLQEGHFERHLRAMRRLVAGRREAMRAAIESDLGGIMEASGSSLGMHVMVRAGRSAPAERAADLEQRIVAAAASRGVAVYPVGPCWSRRPRYATFLLGYAALDEDLIREGVKQLARAAGEALGRGAGRAGAGRR